MFVSVNLMFYVFLTFLHYIEKKKGEKKSICPIEEDGDK